MNTTIKEYMTKEEQELYDPNSMYKMKWRKD